MYHRTWNNFGCLETLRTNFEKIQLDQNHEITVGDLNINYKSRNTQPFKLLKEIERFWSKTIDK